jgi:hypothetical protein
MSNSGKTVRDLLDSVAASIKPGVGYVPELPRVAHSSWREEVIVVYCVGKGKFSVPPDFDQNLQYINLQMDVYDLLSGRWLGYQLGVHVSRSTPEDLLRVPPPPSGAFDDPASQVPHLPVKEYTKGVWTFADGSEIYAVGPAQSHLVPFNDGSFLFMVTTGQTITSGSGRYKDCAGVKQATGTAFIPAGLIQSGRFPAPGLEFEAKTIETFRIVKKQDVGPFPVPPPQQEPQPGEKRPKTTPPRGKRNK